MRNSYPAHGHELRFQDTQKRDGSLFRKNWLALLGEQKIVLSDAVARTSSIIAAPPRYRAKPSGRPRGAAPHLILMAFLQRIINTGGRIDRELATGRGRIDLCIHYENQRYPLEIKIRKDAQTLAEGRTQLSRYMETLGCSEGWLVMFDRRKKPSWKNRLFWKTGKIDQRTVHAVGC